MEKDEEFEQKLEELGQIAIEICVANGMDRETAEYAIRRTMDRVRRGHYTDLLSAKFGPEYLRSN